MKDKHTSLPVLTLVFICVQKVLELRVEDLQVLLDEDLLTLASQLVLRALVEVDLHTPLLLQETSLGLDTHTHTRTRTRTHTHTQRMLNHMTLSLILESHFNKAHTDLDSQTELWF